MNKQTLIVIALILLMSIVGVARTSFYQGSGTIAIEITSGFFEIDWGLNNGFSQFGFYGPNITNTTFASSNGYTSGTFDVTETMFRQTFNGNGSFSSFSELPLGTIALVELTGSTITEIEINVGMIEGKTDLFAFISADYFWLLIKDDRPDLKAKLKLEAIGFSGNAVRMVVRNAGNIAYKGSAKILCGLSYKAWFWFSYSLTHFSLGELDYVEIEAGKVASFDFFLPASIPQNAIDAFVDERNCKMFESAWWHYPDPATDCLDFIIRFDNKDEVHGFSQPINLR